MKRVLLVVLATASLAVAELIPFDLDGGLSPVPAPEGVAPSTGSGGEIETGIWYDTQTLTLTLVLGYGSAAGFSDLTGAATVMHIHGPSGDNPDAVLYDLGPQHFPNSDAAKGGIIRGAVQFQGGAQTNDLFLGKDYVNIHTALYPGGEIRGFLVPVLNQPPVVMCAEDVTEECKCRGGNLVELSAKVSDPEGDAITVIWSVDGEAVQTNSVPAGVAGAETELEFASKFVLGEHMVSVTAADEKHQSECQTRVTIEDTTPPRIRRITTDPRCLWPPNHQLVKVRVRPEISDCTATTWKIVSVTSNEPVNGRGDGNTSPDWVITGDQGLQLRAERSGRGDGRVYTIVIEAADEMGLKSQARVEVRVLHSEGWYWLFRW